MSQAVTKLSFINCLDLTTARLEDTGPVFNLKKVGPANFNMLRNTDYGDGFEMSTMPEIVSLVHSSHEFKRYEAQNLDSMPFIQVYLKNQKYDAAKNIIRTLRDYIITGNTGILYVKEGMFIHDNPRFENRKVIMDAKILETKLGEHEEKHVVLSNDKSIRFTQYGFKNGLQTASELSKNPGVIALAGSEENAEKLTAVSGHYKLEPLFGALSNPDYPQIRVPSLTSSGFCGRFNIYAEETGSCVYMYSFGALK